MRLRLTVLAVVLAGFAMACSSSNESTNEPTQVTLVPPAEVTNGPGVTATTPIATTPSSTGRPGTAPCTADALLEGIAASDDTVEAIGSYACDQQWAHATGDGKPFLLEANGPRWSVVDPSSVCSTATIPSAIRSPGCPSG
jgi:hypothetical protein